MFRYGITGLNFTNERIHSGVDLANLSEQRLPLGQVFGFIEAIGCGLELGLQYSESIYVHPRKIKEAI
jgi:hypothetical protein